MAMSRGRSCRAIRPGDRLSGGSAGSAMCMDRDRGAQELAAEPRRRDQHGGESPSQRGEFLQTVHRATLSMKHLNPPQVALHFSCQKLHNNCRVCPFCPETLEARVLQHPHNGPATPTSISR